MNLLLSHTEFNTIKTATTVVLSTDKGHFGQEMIRVVFRVVAAIVAFVGTGR